MNFVKTVLAVLVAQLLIAALSFGGLAVIGLLMSLGDDTTVHDGSYLVIDIYGEILPYDPPETIATELFGGDPETVHRILTNLEKAAVDDRIEGVLLKVSRSNTLGRASIEEIRAAVGRLRDAGKVVYAYSDALSRPTLFLASACDSIFMAPPGDLFFTGTGVTRAFYKGTLDKLDVKPNIHRIADYKSAAEPILRKDMSPETEEMLTWMLDEFWDLELEGISEGRGIPREDLERQMGHALFTAEEAAEAGLIDGTRFWSELLAGIEPDDGPATVSQSTYADVSRESVGLKGKKRIAVVHAYGMIGGRTTRLDPWGGVIMGHETVARHLRQAADNDRIDAVVFRVDSNGGESLASELIAHEVARVREKKPIVVSMLDVAASGGYTISYKGTRVIADPLTITGSIGSIYGKMNTRGMYEKLGMTFDGVTKGPNALFWSSIHDFTEEQWDRFIDHHYDGFNAWIADISAERGIPVDELLKLAEGRVWTGRQAAGNGLVDETGDLVRAIELAKEEAGIPADEGISVAHYPRKRGLYALLTSEGGPISVANWIAYRFLRNEVRETVRTVTEPRLRVWYGELDR